MLRLAYVIQPEVNCQYQLTRADNYKVIRPGMPLSANWKYVINILRHVPFHINLHVVIIIGPYQPSAGASANMEVLG